MRFKIILIIILSNLFFSKAIAIEENSGEYQLNLINSPYLLGNFGGWRDELEENGIKIESSYIIDSFIMNNRTKKSSKGTYQGLYNLSGELNTGKLGLYEGGKLYILYQVGNKGVSSINFLNSFSDINSYNPGTAINQISELYYEQSFKDDLLNIKIGKQDANMDFQALENGFEFLNLSFSLVPNTPMPIFPSQQTGVRVRLKLPNDFYFQNGFYDGNLEVGANPKSFFTGKNGYFNITEGYKLTNFKDKPGKYLIGGWIKTGDFETQNSSTSKNNYGFYGAFEQKLINYYEDKKGGLSVFAQFGHAKQNVNDVPYYYGIGITLKGITQKRKSDSMGIAFSNYRFNGDIRHSENRISEKVIELFYKIKITSFLYIQPDIQYIIKPNGEGKNSFALGIRSVITF